MKIKDLDFYPNNALKTSLCNARLKRQDSGVQKHRKVEASGDKRESPWYVLISDGQSRGLQTFPSTAAVNILGLGGYGLSHIVFFFFFF